MQGYLKECQTIPMFIAKFSRIVCLNHCRQSQTIDDSRAN